MANVFDEVEREAQQAAPARNVFDEVEMEAARQPPPEPTGLKGIARTIAPYARPVLEYAPALAGSIYGGTVGALSMNPAGVAAGAAIGGGLGYAGGRHMANALDEYAGLREPPTFKNALVQTGQDIGTGAAMEMTGQVAGPVANALLKPAGRFAKGLYEQALKIPPSVPGAVRDRAVKTGLEGGYRISDKGLKSVRENMDSLNSRIADSIDGMVQTKTIKEVIPGKTTTETIPGQMVVTSPGKFRKSTDTPLWFQEGPKYAGSELDQFKNVVPGMGNKGRPDKVIETVIPDRTITREQGTIDMNEVVKRVDQLKTFYQKLGPEAAADYIKPLEDLQRKFSARGFITPKEAQEMKQTLYALNRRHYGELSSTVAEGNKAVARGLKEELVKQHPELEYLNKQDSDLINLEKYLERAVNRINNREMLTLPDVAYTGVGVFSGHPVLGASYAALNKIIKSPNVQSRLAILLNKAQREVKTIPGTKMPIQGIKGRTAAYPVVKNILDRDNADRTILEKDNWTGNNGDL